MIRFSEIPLLLLLIFNLIYSTVGDPDNEIWSGMYFLVNHLTLLLLFYQNKSALVRKIGISLNISILIFIIMTFFLHINYMRLYTLIPFTICLVGIILIEKRVWQK